MNEIGIFFLFETYEVNWLPRKKCNSTFERFKKVSNDFVVENLIKYNSKEENSEKNGI
jgi:hypothetical protein